MKEYNKRIQVHHGFGKGIVISVLTILALSVLAEDVLIEFGSSMVYKDNQSDPGIGLDWIEETFDDSAWTTGTYGVGYGVGDLIQTTVPDSGTYSVYTRAKFTMTDVSAVSNLFLGADYCDGYVAWINGVEVIRSGVPAGTLWNSSATSHESSNGPAPKYIPFNDISSVGIPALHNGENVLAVGVWNSGPSSSDMVVVPKLSTNFSPPLTNRGPYLQMATPTSITVRWGTASLTDSKVSYGLTLGNLNLVVDDITETGEHELTLTGLSPDTQYYYSVGSSTEIFAGGDADHFFITPPPVGSTQPTRIWILGDSGSVNGNSRAVRDAYYAFNGTTYTNLWLMLGDNAYPDGTDTEYQAALFDMYPEILRQSPLWPTLGNHDGKSADSASQTGPYYSIFSLPTLAEAGGVPSATEAYYSFNYGNIHFLCLDSHDTDRSFGGAMYTWLEMDLAVNSSDWLIAFWHYPPYSKGSHNSDSERGLIEMRENFLPLLENNGVDLVLTGHSHGYERSFLLTGHYGNSDENLEPFKIDGGDGRLDGSGAYMKATPGPAPNEGAVYVVSGASSRVNTGSSYDHPAMYLSFGILGSAVIDIDGNTLDLKYLDSAGVVQDYFTIIKNGLSSVDVTIINPVAGTTVSAAVLGQIEATDAEDPAGTLIVEWNVDGGPWQPTTHNISNGLYEGNNSWDTTLVNDGNHIFNARATDSGGDIGQDSNQVNVDNINDPPLATFTYSCVDLTCDFNAVNSSDTDGSIVTYSWDFGDGKFGNSIATNHNYAVNGTYSVVLTVTDDDGETDTDVQSVQVGVEAPTVSISAPADEMRFTQGDTITFTGAAMDAEDDDAMLTASLDWVSDLVGGSIGTGATFDRSDLPAGMHTITASVTDSGGGPGSDSITIAIRAASGIQTIDTRVSADNDDAEERNLTGGIDLGSSDLELVDEGSNQTVGVRFTGLNIPNGANIVDAYVQFQVDEVTTKSASLSIVGEDIDSAATFTSATNNISSRTNTAASVPWVPAPWPTVGEAGPDQRTPNIAAVIQEIVSRPGWSSSNDLVVMLTGSGKRTAESHNGDSAGAALLHVEFLTGGGNLPPTVDINAPADGEVFTEGDMIQFTSTATDPEDGNIAANLNWSSDLDGGFGPGGGSFSIDTLSVEEHTITASVTDSGGEPGSDSISITINAVGNQAPTVTISEPSDGAVFTEGDNITFTATATDPGDGNIAANLTWSSDFDGGIGPGGGSFSIDTLSVGTHTITASVTDSGGLPGSDSISITINSSGGTVTIDVGVLAGDDDAEERNSTGVIDLKSSDNELVDEGSNQTVGVRFNGLTIPSGATIVNAYVQFQVDEVTTQAASLTIVGEDIDNAAIFTTATGDISSRTPTSASVPWDPAPWPTVGEAGPDQRTPNIAAVIQEIVNRGGWASGNSMAIIITGTGRRTAESFDGDGAGAAAKLHVEYTTGGGNLPPTATISEPSNGATFTEGDNITFTATATDPEDGNIVTNLTWSSDLDGGFGPGGGSFSLDTLSVGEHTITASLTDSGGLLGSDSISITVIGAGGTQTIEVRVSADDDDAEEGNLTGGINRSSSDLELVDEGPNQTVGVRFTGLNIPIGATIVNAYVQFQVDEATTNAASLTIVGENIDSAATFVSATNNISSRTTTSALVAWDPAPWPTVGEAGPDQRTPNIAAVIQEIVSRPGWSSGNGLVVILTGSGRRTAESHNGDSAGAALLHVEYTTN